VEVKDMNDLQRGSMNVWEPLGTEVLPL